VYKLGVHGGPIGVVAACLEEILTEGQEGSGSARRHIPTPKQFLAGRLDSILKSHQTRWTSVLSVRLRCTVDHRGVWHKRTSEQIEKNLSLRDLQCPIRDDNFTRELRARRLASLRHKSAAKRQQRCHRLGCADLPNDRTTCEEAV
jgi:hypothetical protein